MFCSIDIGIDIDNMSKEQQEKLSHFLGSVTSIMSNVISNLYAKSRMLKAAMLTTACLMMLAALSHLSVQDVYTGTKEPAINDNTRQHERLASLLPKKIWQMHLKTPVDSEHISDAISWLALNPDYEYVLMGHEGAEDFIQQHFKEHPTLFKITRELKNTGMRSDLLRYLVLSIKGGVYSDIDTEALKPIDSWVPERYRRATRVVVGIEFDRLDGSNWGEVHPDLQFCQWTIAATPAHPLFTHMADFVISALETFATEHNTTFANLKASSSDVMRLTGPAAWTDAVFWYLQRMEPELTSVRDFSGLTEPRLVGDVLILPIDGFGMGQQHSNSTHDGSVPEGALVRHKFRGSWRLDGGSR